MQHRGFTSPVTMQRSGLVLVLRGRLSRLQHLGCPGLESVTRAPPPVQPPLHHDRPSLRSGHTGRPDPAGRASLRDLSPGLAAGDKTAIAVGILLKTGNHPVSNPGIKALGRASSAGSGRILCVFTGLAALWGINTPEANPLAVDLQGAAIDDGRPPHDGRRFR